MSEIFQPEVFQSQLATRRFGRALRHLPVCDSTNAVAAGFARDGAPEGLVVVTDLQTAGRGRMGRTWTAPPGSSLLFSILFRPEAPVGPPAQILMAAGLGAAEGIRRATGLNPRLKWPNDLLLCGRKAGGMLAETEWADGRIAHLIVGIGINVNFDPKNVAGIPPEATSIQLETGRPAARESLLAAILLEIETRYEAAISGRMLTEEWRAHLETIGRCVRVELPGEVFTGTAIRAETDGALVVRTQDGADRKLSAGEVIHLSQTIDELESKQ